MTLPKFALSETASTEHPINFHLKLNSKEGKSFIEHIVKDHILPSENRKRARRRNDFQKLLTVVEILIANFIFSQQRDHKTIFYPRSKRHYSAPKNSYYIPEEVGFGILLSAIKGLESNGLVISVIGSDNLEEKIRRLSTLEPTEKLYRCSSDFNLSPADVSLNRTTVPAIILKDADKSKLPIKLENPLIAALDRDVRAINNHINQFKIGFEVPPDRTRNHQKDSVVALSESYLVRTFNNSSFTQGGRFFGGAWQSIRGDYRRYLTIDGNKTVELDYSGFVTRAIYHFNDMHYDKDPYQIPSAIDLLKSLGAVEESEIRNIIKYQINCMIGASSQYRVPAPKRIGVFKNVPMSADNLKKFRNLILDHHGWIEDFFCSGQGLKFQFVESEICKKILLYSVDRQVPVLPIHDSFITSEDNSDWLKEAMVFAYERELSFEPTIH